MFMFFRKQPIVALYFESEPVLKFYNLRQGPASMLILINLHSVY